MSTAIQSELRVKGKHSTITELRESGFVPAVVYGFGTEPISISVNERDLRKVLSVTGRNGVMQLTVDGKEINVVLSDYQTNPLKGNILHADFLAIDMSLKLEVSVQVNLVGNSIGEKEGGVLQQPNRELNILVKPSDIPEAFDIDISELAIGDTITVAEIRAKSKFEILNDDEYPLILISAPRSEADLEALDAETEANAEPEVIGEVKKEA